MGKRTASDWISRKPLKGFDPVFRVEGGLFPLSFWDVKFASARTYRGDEESLDRILQHGHYAIAQDRD
jgi:hypothetical protein